MRNLLYKFSEFMQGRYGSDELNITLIVLSVIISIVSRFVFNLPVRIILGVVSLGLLGLAVFRFLSTNIYARSAENRKFKPAFKAVTGWFSLTYKKLRDGRTHRYCKCPACKAQLRVKNVKGTHTVRCPKCGNRFEKTIR